MKSITKFYAIDGKEFTNQEECLNYQYNLIDWSKILKQKIFWVSIDFDNDKPVIKDVISFFQPCPNDIYKNIYRYYLYIKNSDGVKRLKDVFDYLTIRDKFVVKDIDIGFNRLVDCGDAWGEIENVGTHLHFLYEDLNEIRAEIDKEEKILKLDSFMPLFND